MVLLFEKQPEAGGLRGTLPMGAAGQVSLLPTCSGNKTAAAVRLTGWALYCAFPACTKNVSFAY
jgi:hypothetical protein